MKYKLNFDIEFLRNPYKGKFIAIEGVDGSGKTTQAKALAKYFEKKGVKCIQTKEPTDEITGKLIREILAGKLNFPPVSFQYLFAADRAIHQEKIKDYLKKGYVVISDRYIWSSVVYGMIDKKVDLEDGKDDRQRLLVALSILSMYHQFMVPDYSICLNVSTNAAMKRINEKGECEIYEKSGILRKLSAGYEWLLKKFPKEIVAIDGGKPVEEVTREIICRIKI